jgi:hypothetical protein
MRNFSFSQLLAVAVAAPILAASGAASANLIVNGSFESPVVPAGSAFGSPNDVTVGSTDITGWTVVGDIDEMVSIISGSALFDSVLFVADDGVQSLDLTGPGSDGFEGVAQTIATTPGNTYQLGYSIGNPTSSLGVLGNTSTINVLINGVPAFSDTNSTQILNTFVWQRFLHTFVASSSSTTLAFMNGDPYGNPGDGHNGLDTVVVVDLGRIETPEPTSLALFGSGLVFVTLVNRLRRRRD